MCVIRIIIRLNVSILSFHLHINAPLLCVLFFIHFNRDIWSKRNTKTAMKLNSLIRNKCTSTEQYCNRVKWPFVGLLRWITIHKRNWAKGITKSLFCFKWIELRGENVIVNVREKDFTFLRIYIILRMHRPN